MLSVEEARAIVERASTPLSPRCVPLHQALGRRLAESVFSDADSPPFDKSMLDGYAISTHHTSATRRVIGQVLAGDGSQESLEDDGAIQIMTGAPIPQGADAVVKQEDVTLVDEQTIRLPESKPTEGGGIYPRGASFRKGDLLLDVGSQLGPTEIALLAEIGKTPLQVIPQPRVSVLATGNELVAHDESLAPGQIRNSNGPLLMASLTALGARASNLGIARDDPFELTEKVQAGLQSDVLLITGGVSVGVMDLVPGILAKLGVDERFHKVRIKPGKPVWFGVLAMDRPTLVFGLPGNPVSTLVAYEIFVKPALEAIAGGRFPPLAETKGTLSQQVAHRGIRPTFHPCRIQSAEQPGALPRVEPLAWRGSGDLATLTRANGLALLPAGDYVLEPNSEVAVHKL